MSHRIPVGILGCTGAVGQKFISLLERHPWFRIADVVASERSAGKTCAGLVIKGPYDRLESRILFSGLDAAVAGDLETQYAELGHLVVSNARNHRMDPNVPLVIPEINGHALNQIQQQPTYIRNGGAIVTNPNCSTTVMAVALYPLYRQFGLDKIMVTTLQALSGAGYPGIPSLDILGNTLPYIAGEEEKMESELSKIFADPNLCISATCNRVPVVDGHTLCLSVSTRQPATYEDLQKAFETTYPTMDLPSSPSPVVQLLPEENRTQPRLDATAGGGMTVSIGRLRPCKILDWKFTVLGHNTVRGAAGGAILNAEWMVRAGLVK